MSDVTEAHRLLHGGESAVWGDAGYQGAEKRPEHAGSGVRWQVAMRPGLRQLLPGALRRQRLALSSALRKRHFGYAQVRYRGLDLLRSASAAAGRASTRLIAGALRPESPAEALPERHGGETTPGPR